MQKNKDMEMLALYITNFLKSYKQDVKYIPIC